MEGTPYPAAVGRTPPLAEEEEEVVYNHEREPAQVPTAEELAP